ncbi:MAG: hypothetical protein B9S32_08175 [Verrucomicrobia bacterium Tous-C9LFEB]|nr:MAG: hypothetical protein B9S32_08175 [Verrucomicrobia bacterium Tous-C9LFEB]
MKNGSSSKLEIIQSELQQEILRKVWKVGDKLPTEAELAVKYKCSVGTVNKAVSLLVHKGLIERKTRMGTRVLSNTIVGTGIKLDAYAFICPSDQHEGVWRAMKGFQSAAQAKKRRMLMLTSGSDYQKEVEIIGRLTEFDVQGAVLYPVVPSFNELVHFSDILQTSKLPVVLVGVGLPGQGISGVSIDGFHAGYTMTRHLLDKGLKRLGFLAYRSWAVSIRDRYQGYKWALSEAGIPLDENLVLLSPSMHLDFDNPLKESIDLSTQYLAQTRDLGLQGVVAASDFMARGLINVALEKGLRIPEDFAVTGIDDYSLASEGPVKLTTYHVPYEEMGRISFEMLESLLETNPAAPSEKHVRGELVVRDSA